MLDNLQTILVNSWAFIQILIGFGILIFVHELGHFLAAKAVNIKVTQFAIGFGHSFLAWRKGIGFRLGSTEEEYEKRLKDDDAAKLLGETEYRLNWIPLGGYVKMLGQDDLDPTATCNDPRSFSAKPFLPRTLVISAGVIMNALFAVVFFIAAFMIGVEFSSPVVGFVSPDKPAAASFAEGYENQQAYMGLKPGDEILKIDGKTIEDFNQVTYTVALGSPDEPMQFTVRRPGENETLQFNITPVAGKESDGLLVVGIGPAYSTRIINYYDDKQPFPHSFADAGIKPGMIVTQVDGLPIERFDQLDQIITRQKGRPVTVTFSSENKSEPQVDIQLAADPLLIQHPNQDVKIVHLLGMVPATSIGMIIKNSPAAEAGLQIGDVLRQIGDIPWPAPDDISNFTNEIRSGDPVELTIIRNGKQQTLTVNTDRKKGKLGISTATQSTLVRETLPKSPFSELHLNPGSKIIRINEQIITSLAQMQRILQELAVQSPEGFEFNVGYLINLAGQQQAESMTISVDAARAKALINAGWTVPPQLHYFEPMQVNLHTTNPGKAIALGIRKTYEFMMHTYLTIYRVAEGSVPVDQMRGPVGIFGIGTLVAQKGIGYLMFFLGLISINLAVINFLPIPILDGGLMVFLIVEKIKGSPASAGVQTAASLIGLAVLGGLILFLTYNDIVDLFHG